MSENAENKLQELIPPLIKDVQKFIDDLDRKRGRNAFFSGALVLLGLGLGLGTVIAGIENYSHLAACLGALLTSIIGLDRAFAFENLARFQEILVVEGKILRSQISKAKSVA